MQRPYGLASSVIKAKPASRTGREKIENTIQYLGVEFEDALEMAEKADVCATGAEPTGSAPADDGVS